jgi:hypothetical protein
MSSWIGSRTRKKRKKPKKNLANASPIDSRVSWNDEKYK